MAQFADDHYARLLTRLFDVDTLDAHPGTVFAIDREGRLVYVNPAWEAFARNNGGDALIERWGLGANYFQALPAVLEEYFRDLFGRVPAAGTALEPATHSYECSSAGVYRRYTMLIYRLPDDAGFLVVNSLVVERPHGRDRQVCAPAPDHYVNDNGFILQCAHCRRIRHVSEPARWDWVPDWVTDPQPNVSHGVCPVCFAYYFESAA